MLGKATRYITLIDQQIAGKMNSACTQILYQISLNRFLKFILKKNKIKFRVWYIIYSVPEGNPCNWKFKVRRMNHSYFGWLKMTWINFRRWILTCKQENIILDISGKVLAYVGAIDGQTRGSSHDDDYDNPSYNVGVKLCFV